MAANRKRIALALAILLLLALAGLLAAELHEAEHHSEDCPLCALARFRQRGGELFAAAVVILCCAAALCLRTRPAGQAPRRAETPVAQKVLLLS